jgi:hypothetical protein
MNSEEHDDNYWDGHDMSTWHGLVPVCVECLGGLTNSSRCNNRKCNLFMLLQEDPPLREPCFGKKVVWILEEHDCQFLKSLKIAPE